MYYNRQLPSQEKLIEAMELIRDSINLEVLVTEYYDWLLDNIPIEGLTIQQRKELSDRLIFIRDTKLKHIEMLIKIYRDFKGIELEITPSEFVPPKSFIEGIKTSLFEEANLIRRYREIMFKFPGNYYRDILFEIVSDELIISDLFNYIYTTVLHATQER